VKALVTGGAGFIGRHFVQELRRREYEVTAVDIKGGDPDVWIADMRTWLHGDNTHYDLVVHAAAMAPHRVAIDSSPASHIYNACLDAEMFRWAISKEPDRVLYFSSCAVLDEQPDAYGILKLSGEHLAYLVRDAGVPVTVVRPFSGYGEDQGTDWPFGAFLGRVSRREDPFVVWGTGNQVRDWIHVDDIVAGAFAIMDSGTEKSVSLCTGIGTSMVSLARMMCAEVGYEPVFRFTEQSGGASLRVGDPTEMREFYQPRITIQDGVKRALAT
jgi:nucleoside-diphosphate-sugar epimerase